MSTILKKQGVNRSVLDLAYERLHHAFDLYDTIDVSFSGGKDSTVCLHLALEVARARGRLPLRVFFFDEEAIPYQTEDYVRRVAQRPDVSFEWYCLPVKHRNACSRQHPWWSPWDPAEREKWVRPLPPEGITRLAGFRTDGEPRDRLSIPDANGLLHDPGRYGTVGMVMGIRAAESMTRYRAVATKEDENYLIHWTDGTSRGNIWKVYPIYDWQTSDVWTAPARFGWDYNRAYDVMDQMGISAHEQRCSPAYGEEPMRGFRQFKSCFPEVWDRMSVRVPGANAALLYARSELFGYGGIPEKPEDMSWQEYVTHFIAKFAGPEASATAKNVRELMDRHYHKTQDPILSTVPHPVTGVSWRYIANVAVRGDLKGRRTQHSLHNAKRTEDIAADPEGAYAAYNAARKEEGL